MRSILSVNSSVPSAARIRFPVRTSVLALIWVCSNEYTNYSKATPVLPWSATRKPEKFWLSSAARASNPIILLVHWPNPTNLFLIEPLPVAIRLAPYLKSILLPPVWKKASSTLTLPSRILVKFGSASTATATGTSINMGEPKALSTWSKPFKGVTTSFFIRWEKQLARASWLNGPSYLVWVNLPVLILSVKPTAWYPLPSGGGKVLVSVWVFAVLITTLSVKVTYWSPPSR